MSGTLCGLPENLAQPELRWGLEPVEGVELPGGSWRGSMMLPAPMDRCRLCMVGCEGF